MTVFRHVPEKDGVLACLLMIEMRAMEGKSFKQVLKELYREVGLYVVGRDNFRLTQAGKDKLIKQLEKNPPETLAGKKSGKNMSRLMGISLYWMDGSWLGIRFSGTEPVVRLYLEARSEAALKQAACCGTPVYYR